VASRLIGSHAVVQVIAWAGPILWGNVSATEIDMFRPRVPADQLAAARALKDPLAATPAVIEQGRSLYHGKSFCIACHGREGRGITNVDPTLLTGALPTDFSNRTWQAARTDGELMWVLKNGSSGTAMASFVPSVLTEEEGWQVIHYLRSLGGR
jgi:mono/diheme cytochrome c family protein